MTAPMQTKPFDRAELEKCAFCGKGMMHGGDIHFYEVTIGQCVVDVTAVKQQHGMEMLMGHPAIAAALSPTTTVAHRLPARRRLMCSGCALEPQLLPVLLEDE